MLPKSSHADAETWCSKGFLFVAIVVAAMLAFPRGTVYQYTVEQDEIWRQPNLHAPFTFAIQKPADELERERDDVRSRTSPIFQENAEAVAELRMAAEELGDRFDRVLGKYASYVENRTRGRLEVALQDSLSPRGRR